MAKKVNGRMVKTADTIFGIIEILRELDGATVTEVANYMNIAASTAHTHLSTLQQKGYVMKNDNIFKLSFKFLDYGTTYETNTRL